MFILLAREIVCLGLCHRSDCCPWPPPRPGSNLNLIPVWKFAHFVSLPRASSHSGGTNWNSAWNWVWKASDNDYGQAGGDFSESDYVGLSIIPSVEEREESLSNCDCSHCGRFRHYKTIKTNEWINLRSFASSSPPFAPISGKMFLWSVMSDWVTC